MFSYLFELTLSLIDALRRWPPGEVSSGPFAPQDVGINTATTASPPPTAAHLDYAPQRTQQGFYAGEVDFYLIREEKKFIVTTVGKGQCFGLIPTLPPRDLFRALVVENDKLEAQLKEMPQLMTCILRTLAQQANVVNELIGARVNHQPDLPVHAQLLQLPSAAEVGKGNMEAIQKRMLKQ